MLTLQVFPVHSGEHPHIQVLVGLAAQEAHSEARDTHRCGGTIGSVNLVLMQTADMRGCIILGSAMRGPELLGEVKQQREPPPLPRGPQNFHPTQVSPSTGMVDKEQQVPIPGDTEAVLLSGVQGVLPRGSGHAGLGTSTA